MFETYTMTIKESYDEWSLQYNSNENKTRDLEAKALRESLHEFLPGDWMEAGCGTGKNTGWLAAKAKTLIAADFSEGMLQVAKEKRTAPNIHFVTADLTKAWTFIENDSLDLIVFSLVLEHIEQLRPIMEKVAAALRPAGKLYIAELHPYKQYQGTKARFQTGNGLHELTCYVHHLSDYLLAANNTGLSLVAIQEYFDEDKGAAGSSSPPRLLVMQFQKK